MEVECEALRKWSLPVSSDPLDPMMLPISITWILEEHMTE